MTVLRTERDVLDTLRGKTIRLSDLYRACEDAGVTTRASGRDLIHGRTDLRWKRRARNALQSAKAAGAARRVDREQWVLDGTAERPACLLLLLGDQCLVEVVLSDAGRFLAEQDEQPDLILADPPWGLGVNETGRRDRDNAERQYARNAQQVVSGYVDVPTHLYQEFTERWVTSAASLLRPGAYLAIVTGPAQAAGVQVAAEAAGLEFLNQLIVPRPFALPTSRRFSHAHSCVTVLCQGPERNRARFFAVPADMPKAKSGRDYPLDVWSDVGKHERRGQLRYPTMLHPAVPDRLIKAFTPGPENGGRPWESLVVDPFVGGGASAVAALDNERRFAGSDVNPDAVRFTGARLINRNRQPELPLR